MHKISPAEQKLFRDTVAKENPPIKESDANAADESGDDARGVNRLGARRGVFINKTAQGEYVEFARGDARKKAMRKLKRGDYRVAAALDLHGKTRDESRAALDAVLARAGGEVVRIIHGKGLRSGAGGGVLKQFTLTYLKSHPRVVAFCSATQQDGGTGAVYVMLRK